MNTNASVFASLWFFVLGFVAFCVGCSSSEQAATQAATLDSENQKPELTAANERTIAVTTSRKVPAEWLVPFEKEENFFATPKIAEQTNQFIEATEEHQSVRLLGFANSHDGATQTKKAILKIGDDMVFMLEGDSELGVELLHINGNTVQLQRGRARWNLALMKQPLVNPGINPPASNRRRSHRDSPKRSVQKKTVWAPSVESNIAPQVPAPNLPPSSPLNLNTEVEVGPTPDLDIRAPDQLDAELGIEEFDLSLPELPDLDEEPDFPIP